jgi:hypothetical protein
VVVALRLECRQTLLPLLLLLLVRVQGPLLPASVIRGGTRHTLRNLLQ